MIILSILKSIFSVLILLAVFSLSVFVPVQTVHACSCILPRAPAEEFEDSTAVFSGKVISIENEDFGYKANFEVDRIWKGLSGSTVVISTARDSAACGFGFEEGKEYIVYAHGEGEALSTNLCSRTHLLTENDSDVEALGESTAPVEEERTGSTSGVSPGAYIALVIVVLGAVVIVYKSAASSRNNPEISP
mgnify:CR=1 FL=1